METTNEFLGVAEDKSELIVENKDSLSFHKTYWVPLLSINSKAKIIRGTSRRGSSSSNEEHISNKKNLKEALEKSLSKLRSSYWSECLLGLQDIVQVARKSPQMLTESTTDIYKAIAALLLSSRPAAERTASQAAKHIFTNVSTVQGPEFEELVRALLQKSTDNNPHLRKDVLAALTAMVLHLAPDQYMKILLHKKNYVGKPLLKTTLAKLLALALENLDANEETYLNEELKTRLVQTTITLLQDKCPEVRYQGVRLMKQLKENKEYKSVLICKVSIPVLKRINKIVEETEKEKN